MRDPQKKILVIDDQRTIRTLLGTLLRKEYEVVTLADGMDALRWLHAPNRPDLIILDLQMPRLDGRTFLRHLRASGYFRHIPVVVVSGDGDQFVSPDSDGFGVAAVLTKPFSPIKLNTTLTELLARVPVA